FCRLLVRARIQLGGPIVLVWDNVRLHLTLCISEFIDRNSDWLTVFQLPTYAPDTLPEVPWERRFARLDETVALWRGMWAGSTSFHGEILRFDDIPPGGKQRRRRGVVAKKRQGL
ncbi:hypothetical protein ACFU9V_49440, partial [Streptomyces sp. NPDC057557]